MSKDSAAAFIKTVNDTLTLQDEITLIPGNFFGLLMIAARVGYSFTAAQWQAAASSEIEQAGADSWVDAFLDESGPVRSGV